MVMNLVSGWLPFPLELALLATKLPNICLQCKMTHKNTKGKASEDI